MSATKALVTSIDPKGIRATALFHAKYNKARLDDARAQRLNNSHEFWVSLEGLIQQHSAVNQFVNEVVASSYRYPSGYAPKPLEAQIAILRTYWPKLEPGKALIELERKPLVNGAEAPFAFVRFQALAASYNDAFEKEMIPALVKSRNGKFTNYWDGQLGPEYLRQSVCTAEALELLFAQQKSDILVAPAQVSARYRGKSVRRAREIFDEGEFGMSSLMAGSVLVVHPGREAQWEQLHMDCAGDEFASDADGAFDLAPFFDCHDGGLKFLAAGVDVPGDRYGSASAFVSQ